MDWDFTPPPLSDFKDHDVNPKGQALAGRRIALLITGSIAAYRAPDLIRELRREGAEVVVFASKESLRYVAKEALAWTSLHPVVDEFTADAEHLSDSAPFHAYLVAPATYNVINKMALGMADSVVTSTLASALGKMAQGQASVLVAPAMHGSMHNSILTESFKKLRTLGVQIIPPRQEYGKNNLASLEVIVAEVIRSLTFASLHGKEILVTGGATPVYLDRIRCLTNHFTGALAIQIAQEAYFRGAKVHLVLGAKSQVPPGYLPHQAIATYDDYVTTVETLLKTHPISCGIFSAAVADYRPEAIFAGKIPSGQPQTLKLLPTEKVIQRVRSQFPELFMVTFKYEENMTHEELLKVAQTRLDAGYPLIVANRGNEKGAHGEQVAWLIEQDHTPQKMLGKPQIAQALLERLAEKL